MWTENSQKLKDACFLRVPWTARRTNLSILKEINPECSLEGQVLKLRLQYFGHLMRREDSLEKTLMLGKCEGNRRRGWQRMKWLNNVIKAINMNLTQLWEAVEDRRAWRALLHGVTKSQTWLNNNDNKQRPGNRNILPLDETQFSGLCSHCSFGNNIKQIHAIL